jgi:glycosyltransferase involved in cell wall biosynthesis
MKMKLGYLCSSTSWGGLEMNHAKNAKWMMDRNHSVVFFCVKGAPLEKYLNDLNVPVIFIEKQKKYYDFSKAKALRKLIEKNHISHLIIRSTYDMSIAATVKWKLKNTVKTAYFMEMQLGVKKTNLLHTLRFKYIDLWSCPLNWLQEQVKNLTNFKNELTVIPSGLDLSQFNNNRTKEECLAELNLPKNTLLFGLIGRFDPQKGQLILLNALKIAKNQDFQVVLLGEPTIDEGMAYFDEMQAAIAENKLENRVHIRPFMKDVSVFFKSIDWFVMATKAETFGMVTIESMASGIPVLGSNAGGTPEILQEPKGGCLFETLNEQSLAEKLDEISSQTTSISPEVLKEMATVYDHHKVCAQVEKFLKISI